MKRVSPGVKTAIVTDQSVVNRDVFDQVISHRGDEGEAAAFAQKDRGNYFHKISLMALSPFERTIFLDTDTYVARPLEGLFALLDRYDMLVTPSSNAEVDFEFERTHAPFSSIPKELGDFNTGVLAYRWSDAMRQFFQDWAANFDTHGRHLTSNDQPAFRLTLFQSSLRYHTLAPIYNWVSWIPNFIPSGGGVVVLHGRNPWLQKWVRRLDADVPTIVGSTSWRHQMVHFGSRLLYWLQRKGLIKAPKV
ncbi:MAG: hypothetical protein ACO1TE_25210 [Prosthecobacter sp.]